MKRKAQTQVITIVLISGIVISLVGTAYLWGIPLISKRTSMSDFMTAEDFIVNLDKKIVDLTNRGSGVASLSIPKGLVMVRDYTDSRDDNNSIILEVLTNQPLISGSSTVFLKTNILGENATYGEAEPRVISMISQSYGSAYKLIFKLHYRELDMKDDDTGYKIAMKEGSISGSNEIVLSYDGTTEITGGSMNGGNLVLTKIKVDLV